LLEIGGARVQTYFSPDGGVGNTVAGLVSGAQSRVHFLAFSLTHDGIGQALAERRRAGIEIQGVFETTGSNTEFSELARLRGAGAQVRQDGNRYSMHHKVMVLDDQRTIFGSFNFSRNADEENDENLLVVDDPRFAALFDAEFKRVWDEARR
jgi:phosphatidylserine/phosphatidylglycerophosphate/cardiolipin synthase-like enzyme